jgi:hypothetical protein
MAYRGIFSRAATAGAAICFPFIATANMAGEFTNCNRRLWSTRLPPNRIGALPTGCVIFIIGIRNRPIMVIPERSRLAAA